MIALVDSIFVLLMGGKMCLFLILSWCWALIVSRRGPYLLRHNSRFGEFSSRFGGCEFPVHTATGIFRQGLEFARRFSSQTAVVGRKSTKLPVRREKPGIVPRSAKRARAGES